MSRTILFLVTLAVWAPPLSLSAQPLPGETERARQEHAVLLGDEPSWLNYRTLAESQPSSDVFTIWWPELWSSYNSEAPWGMNDGALWQGKGLNSTLSAGFGFAYQGFELTLLPQAAMEQNLAFELVPAAFQNPYSYFWGPGIDAPQRMGPDTRWVLSWGDSEIRYSWQNLTLGFGTQLPWVGPGKVMSLLHSNNAVPYPKVDLGLRKTTLRWGEWNLGDVEARLWVGYLSESEFFDSKPRNDHNMISFLSLAAAPALLPGLTLMLNRSFLAPWKTESLGAISKLFLVRFDGIGSDDQWDQRFGFGFDYRFPAAGAEVYGEMAYNDNPAQNLLGILRNFEHTAIYTGGLRKAFPLGGGSSLELGYEWTNTEMSTSYSQFLWATNFYMHHLITQGYTNEGQWLGGGIGAGGNSQQLSGQWFWPEGSAKLVFWRYNPDNDFIIQRTINTTSTGTTYGMSDFKAVLAVEGTVTWKYDSHWEFSVGTGLAQIQNPVYHGTWLDPTLLWNFRGTAGARWFP